MHAPGAMSFILFGYKVKWNKIKVHMYMKRVSLIEFTTAKTGYTKKGQEYIIG